jgi:hypothetical protein
MKILLLALLSLGICLPSSAQTSFSCSGAGRCGQTISHAGSNSSNNNFWEGIAFVVTASNLTVSDLLISIEATDTSGHIVGMLVCDSNTSGATIGNSSPCPTNNVLCNTGSILDPAVGDDSFAVSGCGTLSTSARYWVFWNNDASSIAYYNATSGGNDAFYNSAGNTCCSVPSSATFSGLSDTGSMDVFAATLSSTSGAVCNSHMALMGVGCN